MRVPVIVELDETGEATGEVHYFCCTGCRSQSPHHDPACCDEDFTPEDILPGVQCEVCRREILRNADS